MNRGIAKRSAFEDRECVRFFLSRLALESRRRDLEIHAFSVLTTHFHLLVHSPVGRLSEAMRRSQNEYVRWFNRRAKRDGPLFRGRFRSQVVGNLHYRRCLVRYIDANAVDAGLVDRAELYPYCSAYSYARASSPPWLTGCWIEEESLRRTARPAFEAGVYQEAFGKASSEDKEWIERRLARSSDEPDPLDDLVGAAPDRVRRWMVQKAQLADGTQPGWACVSAANVFGIVEQEKQRLATREVGSGKRKIEADVVLTIALLRDLAGLSWNEISLRSAAGRTSCARYYRIHRESMKESEEYARWAGEVVALCLRAGQSGRIGPGTV